MKFLWITLHPLLLFLNDIILSLLFDLKFLKSLFLVNKSLVRLFNLIVEFFSLFKIILLYFWSQDGILVLSRGHFKELLSLLLELLISEKFSKVLKILLAIFSIMGYLLLFLNKTSFWIIVDKGGKPVVLLLFILLRFVVFKWVSLSLII